MSKAQSWTFLVVLPRMQGVEISDSGDAENHRLAVDDELLVPVLQRPLDDPGKATGLAVAG